MNAPVEQPIGVVLAGGLGRRIGGAKAVVELAGRALVSYPVQALQGALSEVRVVIKPGMAVPAMADVQTWTEPAQPQHPLTGIVHALRMAAPRSVLICAADMPFVAPATVSRLARADPGDAPAVVAARDGRLEPLLGHYWSPAAELLEPAARESRQPLRAAVAAIRPRLVEVDPEQLFNVNTPDDLSRAEAILSRR